MLATAEGKSRGNPYIGILSNQSDGRDHQFHWVDNTPLEFTNWAKNEPDGKSEDGSIYQTVVEVFSHTHDTGIAGQWIDQTKSYERAYMCSHQTVATEIGTGYDDCPNGWIQLRHFCYKMFTNPLRHRFLTHSEGHKYEFHITYTIQLLLKPLKLYGSTICMSGPAGREWHQRKR